MLIINIKWKNQAIKIICTIDQFHKNIKKTDLQKVILKTVNISCFWVA